MKTFLMFLFAPIPALILLYSGYYILDKPIERIAPRYVVARHIHHGIWCSIEYRGKEYFYRNGEKVNL